jgi:hypothetical protein
VTASVATAEDLEELRTELARLAAEVAELRAARAGEREVYSPKEIAKRFKLRQSDVYEACRSGALVCEPRPHARGVAYQITVADASRWRAAVGKTNQ